MTNLAIKETIDRSKLSNTQYLVSLIAQAKELSLINESELIHFQSGMAMLLTRQLEMYTKGSSSSVREECASNILSSIAYVIGIALKNCSEPETAVMRLREENVSAIFDEGIRIIERKVKTVKLLHRKLTSNLFQTRNVFYRSTIVDGISGFFKLYNPQFSAHEIHITADYPTFLKVGKYAGIEFIERYLQLLAYENHFCGYFSPASVHSLLSTLAGNYQQVLMNIFEPILTCSLCCLLTGDRVSELNCDLKLLGARLTNNDVDTLLTCAADDLCNHLSCPDGLAAYIRRCLPKIALEITDAVKNNRLETILPHQSEHVTSQKLILSYGERMSDMAYLRVLEQIMQSEDAEDKAAVILAEIHSIGDLLEILHDAELETSDLSIIFGKLPPEAIAALMVSYPNADFLSDFSDESIYNALSAFLEQLPYEQREKLIKVSKLIKLEM